MTLHVFHKNIYDDANFLHLLSSNPDGYVLNFGSPGYMPFIKIHKTSCRFINKECYAPHTGSGYTKVFAESVAEIMQWQNDNGVAEATFCEGCFKPVSK